MDYFIHKDLGGFLKRELDFYIKNEVMNLDDVQNAAAFGAIEKNLRMIQCLRTIALHLIAFLAQIVDQVADRVRVDLEVLQRDLALEIKDLVHVVAALDEGDVPLADVADALGVLEEGGGHEGDVAEAGAACLARDHAGF